MMRRLALAGTLVLLGSILALVVRSGRGLASAEGPTVRPCRKDLVVTLTERGRVEASETRRVYTGVQGEITFLIDEGSDVREGDTVARLSNEDIEEQYEEAKLDVALAKAQLKRSRRSFELLKKKLDLTVKQREAQAELAKWELESVRRKADETEIKRREMVMEMRKHQLEFADIELEAAKRLMKSGSAGSVEEYKNKEIAHRDAEVEYRRAADLFQSAQSEPNRRRLEVALGRLQRAERMLAQARLSREEQVIVAARNIDIREAGTKKIRDRVEALGHEVAHLVVKSPASGQVVYPEVSKGSTEERSRVRVGETRWRGGDLMVVSNTDRMIVRVPVNECDIAMVRVGQEARVRLLAYPGRTYRAEVVEVSLHAVDKNTRLGYLARLREGLAGVAVVDVLVEIRDADENVCLGLSAEVEIVVKTVKNALVIPHSAVQYDNGTAVCRVVTGGKDEERAVVLGASNAFDVAVVENLSEEDVLLDGTCRD